MVKKSQWKTHQILLKMDIYNEDNTFVSSKPGNFNGEVTFIMNQCQCQNKLLWLFFTSFR